MGAILAFLGSSVGWLSSFLLSLFGGWKALLLVTGLGFLSIGLYNLVVEIVIELSSYIINMLSTVSSPTGPSLTADFAGVAGYLAAHLKLVECFAFIVQVVVLKWTMVKIPFLKW